MIVKKSHFRSYLISRFAPIYFAQCKVVHLPCTVVQKSTPLNVTQCTYRFAQMNQGLHLWCLLFFVVAVGGAGMPGIVAELITWKGRSWVSHTYIIMYSGLG